MRKTNTWTVPGDTHAQQTWPRKAERKTTQFCRKGGGKN